MSEQPKQKWRFELGRTPRECKVFLNDEQWMNVVWLKIEAGWDQSGNAQVTKLTFSVLPHEIQVDIAPSLQGALQHQSGITPDTYCYCGHQARGHERLSDGHYGVCLMPRNPRFPPCGICGGFARPYSTDPLHEPQPGGLDDGLFSER
jgi:hypothetical protein